MIETHSVAAVLPAQRSRRILALAALLLLAMTIASLLQACAPRSDKARPATTPDATLPPGPEGELLRAAAFGDIFRVDELLDAGVDINARQVLDWCERRTASTTCD